MALRVVRDDVEQIVKLTAEEKRLIAELRESLKCLPQNMFSVSVPADGLLAKDGRFTHARIDSAGHLILTAEDGHMKVMDIGDPENRELVVSVIGDFVPRLKDYASQLEEEKIQRAEPVEEAPLPEPFPKMDVPAEASTEIIGSDEVLQKAPEEQGDVDAESMQEQAPVLSVEAKARIEEVTKETLEYLEMLGKEKFEQGQVSVYFDDWLVNLRQVILSLESSGVVTVDDIFKDECERIFSDIEEELAKRLLRDAELEASSRTLAEKRYILRKMDDEYSSQSRDLELRGKSAIDFLIKNVQRLEEELAKMEQIKTLNPIKRIAKEQKRFHLTQKLKAAKQRLALAMQKSVATHHKLKVEDVEIGDLARDRLAEGKSIVDALIKKVNKLEEELAKIDQVKTNILHPLKKIAQEKRRAELTEELEDTKQKLALAAQEYAIEQQRVHEEYEKKKQETIRNVQSLEKEIARKKVDDSLEARKSATVALTNAVRELIKRNMEATEQM